MSRASAVLAGTLAAALAALGVPALADDHPAPTSAGPVEPAPRLAPSAAVARAHISAQLADEAATIARTEATIAGKLAEADAVRLARLRAAYRLLRAAPRTNASPADRMAAARRRAGARLLVDRDAHERALLAEEAALLRAASERIVVAAGQLPTLAEPEPLAWPAHGAIVRRFGTLVHERSRTTLARRGIDLEVATGANVSAPADGIVRYAGPIRGLDEGVIVDHGDYFTVIAKLGELIVPVGGTGQARRSARARRAPSRLPRGPRPDRPRRSSDRSRAAARELALRARERTRRSVIAAEAPGWRGDGEDRRGASSSDVTRGPEPATKPVGMDRPRGRSTCPFAGPKLRACPGPRTSPRSPRAP